MRKIEQEIKDLGIYKPKSRNARNRQMKEIERIKNSVNNLSTHADAIIEDIRNSWIAIIQKRLLYSQSYPPKEYTSSGDLSQTIFSYVRDNQHDELS